MKKFYLTTPIYYPNARPHVGNSYTSIVCDVIARYKRMCGYDVAFLTGTDEHGEKLERTAAAAGVSPREFVTEKRKLFIELWEKLGIHNLRFVYTDQRDHVTSVRRMLIRARQKGYIDKRRYEGRYCVSDERYISDGAEPANCDICGRPAELISEENYFFELSQFGGEDGPLMRLYRGNPGFVQPEYRMNEVKSFVKSGLRDISVSRKRIKWGIPFPLDPERDDPEQVVYVWYDALTSYLTGIGFAEGENGSAEFQKYWPADLHMVGKDILRFHAVYWPAFLMAADLPLPKTIFAHGWVYYEQDKMSKSKGNVVYPEPIIDALESFGAPGNDALRYYLLREAPFGQDMSFSYEGLIQRYNSDLANDLGNLANRTITMLHKLFGGKVPAPVPGSGIYSHLAVPLDLPTEEQEIEVKATETGGRYRENFDSYKFSQALECAWELVARFNKYLVDNHPWTWLKEFDPEQGKDVATKPEHVRTVLYAAAEALRFNAVMLYPVFPSASERLWAQLGCEEYLGKLENQRIDQLKWGELKPGSEVGLPEPIFPRLDKAATLARLDEFAEADRERDQPKEALKSVQTESGKEPQAVPAPAPEPRTPSPESRTASPQPLAPSPTPISIEDFAKVEMRVGEVKAAERVAGTAKLLKLMVDIGDEVRQLVAGIAEYYEPEKLLGMKVVVVTNLQPRKVRGVESNGMIVAATVGPEGRPVLVTFKEDVPNGARLK